MHFRKLIENAFCCNWAVHYSLGKKMSSNDLAKTQAIRRWGLQRQYRYHTISTEYVVILKFSAHAGDARSGIIILEKSYCSGERRVGRSGTVSHRVSHQYLTAFILQTMACSFVRCPWDIHAQTSTPLLPCATLRTTVTSAFCSAVWQHTRLPTICSVKLETWLITEEHIPTSRYYPADVPLPTHLSRCCRWALVRSNQRRGRCARELASLSRFPKVWSDIRGLNKQIVSSAVAGTGMTRSGVEMKNPDIT